MQTDDAVLIKSSISVPVNQHGELKQCWRVVVAYTIPVIDLSFIRRLA